MDHQISYDLAISQLSLFVYNILNVYIQTAAIACSFGLLPIRPIDFGNDKW